MKKLTTTNPAVTPKSNRNARQAGTRYEQVCAQQLREVGFEHVVTSRAESKSRDDQKIDLMNRNEAVNGRLPYNVQCKSYNTHLKYHQVLGEIQHTPGIINVIFHKLTSNKGAANKTNKFVTLGYYAILHKRDFLFMIKQLLVFGKQHEELVTQNNALRKENERLEKQLKDAKSLAVFAAKETGRFF